MARTVVIGTRGSALALVQADIAAAALRAADPSLAIEVKVITTQGDVNQAPIPLDENGKGWFTKEIEAALLDASIDIAVHSLKDMADEQPPGLALGAYLPREDARDALVTRDGRPLEQLPNGAVIGTDSIRRQVQMLAMKPDARMESLRGNVPTRLKKLDDGVAASEDGSPYDAIILAAAGLKRLGLEQRVTRYFSFEEMTSAPGQGIMAVEARASDAEMLALLARVNDEEAARAAHIERAFSRAMGGGCKSPVGAYAHRDGDTVRLVGMTLDIAGRIVRDEKAAPVAASGDLGEMLAQELLARGGHMQGRP